MASKVKKEFHVPARLEHDERIVNKMVMRDHGGVVITSREFGRRAGNVDCPFCGEINYVYVWSLSGSGKRCEKCGVLLTAGVAVMEVE